MYAIIILNTVAEDIDQTITLYYPKNSEVYPLVIPLKDDYDPIHDILQTARVIGI